VQTFVSAVEFAVLLTLFMRKYSSLELGWGAICSMRMILNLKQLVSNTNGQILSVQKPAGHGSGTRVEHGFEIATRTRTRTPAGTNPRVYPRPVSILNDFYRMESTLLSRIRHSFRVSNRHWTVDSSPHLAIRKMLNLLLHPGLTFGVPGHFR
jgi:hypothetical protein